MPRGRSPGFDGQREMILERAGELFARKGYAATSMNEVAEACGLSKATLYHYVRDKDGLLVHIAEAHVAQLQALVAEVEARGLEPEAWLRALVTRFVQAYAGAANAQRVLTEDVRFLGEADRARILAAEREVVAGLARAVAAVRPELRGAHLDKPLTMLLFGMINWMFTWLRPGGALDHDAMAPLVVDLFLGGLPAVRVPAAPRSRPARASTSPAPAPAPVRSTAPAPAPAPTTPETRTP